MEDDFSFFKEKEKNNFSSFDLFAKPSESAVDTAFKTDANTFGSNSLDFGKKDGLTDFLGSDAFKNSLAALNLVGNLGQTFLGFKGLSQAKKEFKHNKKIDLFNARSSASEYNTRMASLAKQANQLQAGTVSNDEIESRKLKL